MAFKLSRDDLLINFCYGSQATIEKGSGATRNAPLGCDDRWFADSSTIILGVDEANQNQQKNSTIVNWHIPIEPISTQKVKSGFLIIACERQQGGLHTQHYGATAKVEINGHNRDIIGLKEVPAGHTDYFHRVPTLKIPNVWPISGCGTVYAWAIHPKHLSISGNQIVRVEVDPHVSWDIDYVMLALSKNVSFFQIPGWLKNIIYLLIGAVLGAIANKIITG